MKIIISFIISLAICIGFISIVKLFNDYMSEGRIFVLFLVFILFSGFIGIYLDLRESNNRK